MRKIYEIVDREDIVRDGHSKALIARDPSILMKEHARKLAHLKNQATEQRISNLEESMAEIKSLLQKLVNK